MQREFPEAPLVGVGGIVVDEQGRVLLIERGNEPMKGAWTIPGGLVELGESLEQATRREIAEETGLEVQILGLVELLDRIYKENEAVRYHYVIADYLCRATGGTLRANDDAADARWLAPAEFASLNLDAVTLRVVQKALAMAAQK